MATGPDFLLSWPAAKDDLYQRYVCGGRVIPYHCKGKYTPNGKHVGVTVRFKDLRETAPSTEDIVQVTLQGYLKGNIREYFIAAASAKKKRHRPVELRHKDAYYDDQWDRLHSGGIEELPEPPVKRKLFTNK